jgi:integrase
MLPIAGHTGGISLAASRCSRISEMQDQVTAQQIESYKVFRLSQIGERTGRKLKPATVNRELACGKAMFNHARKAHRGLPNPFSEVNFYAENNEQTRVLTFQEEALYLNAASRPLKDIATLMLQTGMRPEEVYRIQRQNVHLDQNYLFNPYGKTKAARRKVRLTSAAKLVLATRLSESKSDYLFPCETESSRPIPKINNAHDRLFIQKSKDLPAPLQSVPRFRLYDLRHTWATRAAMSGIDLVTLAAMLGHSRIQMVLRYAHPTDDHQAQAMRRVEEFSAAQQIAFRGGTAANVAVH